MSDQLIRFTEESLNRVRRGQVKWAWLMVMAIVLIIVGIVSLLGGVSAAQPFVGVGLLFMVVAAAGWSFAGKRIQRLEREHLEARALFEHQRR